MDMVAGWQETDHWKYSPIVDRTVPRYREPKMKIPKPQTYDEAGMTQAVKDFIPFEWRDVICMCYVVTDKKNDIHHCGKCGKYRRWLYRIECDTCHNGYLAYFQHRESADNQKTCYDCLVAEFGEEPGDYNRAADAKPKELRSLSEMFAEDDILFDF